MLKILNAGCFGLSLAMSSQLSVGMCAAFKNVEKFTRKPFWKGFKVVQNLKKI